MMTVWTLPKLDLKPLDDLMFQSNGLLRVVPAKTLQSFSQEMLQFWCVKRGVYQYPTEELINFLANLIKGKKAIEIGAGNGAIGRALGITLTDSYMQTEPAMAAYYRLFHQEPITPPQDVLKFEGVEAVRYFKPEVVMSFLAYSTVATWGP